LAPTTSKNDDEEEEEDDDEDDEDFDASKYDLIADPVIAKKIEKK
jgi:hypothetical protein